MCSSDLISRRVNNRSKVLYNRVALYIQKQGRHGKIDVMAKYRREMNEKKEKEQWSIIEVQ